MIDDGEIIQPFSPPKKIREFVLKQIEKVKIDEV